MDKKLLDEIIVKMEQIGFKIHGIICDLGNQRLLSELHFYDKKFFCFDNPADPSRKVRIFPDAPHLLKLARTHLIRQGFRIPLGDGTFTILGKRDLQKVLDVEAHCELKKLHRFSKSHLRVESHDCQNVRLAAQVFSHTVAKAITWMQPEDKKLKVKSDAIQLFNDWFDVCNSDGRFHSNIYKNRLSEQHIVEQMHILNKMEKFLHEFEVNTPYKNQYWVTGMLCNIHSTRALYRDLVTEGPFNYIITKRLNQDFLEVILSKNLKILR